MASNITHAIRAGRNVISATTDLDPLVQASRINNVRETRAEFVEEPSWQLFIITGFERFDPLVYQWRYTARKAFPVGPIEGGSSESAVQWSIGGAEDHRLYNGRESLNATDSEYFGNGVKRADLPDGFELSPIPIDSPVMAKYFSFPGGGEWRFFEPNGVTGVCSTGSGS